MSRDPNKKSQSFYASIAALSGVLTFVGGYFLNTRLHASSVDIGNATNINDLPSFQCDLAAKNFVKDYVVCASPGCATIDLTNSANNRFWDNLPNYDKSRLAETCQILQQLCSAKNATKLYRFIAENVTKNSNNTQNFFGNCDTTTFFGEIFMGLGVIIIVAALISFLVIAGNYYHDKKKNQESLQASLITNRVGSSHLFGSTHSDQQSNTSSSLVRSIA